MPNKHQCPCCDLPCDLQIQITRKGDLHMATCHNPSCPLCGYTLTTEGYSKLRWEMYIKDKALLSKTLDTISKAKAG